jgi:hypothetical protein
MASLSQRLAASTATHSRIASGNGSTKSTMKRAANNSTGTESSASPSKKLRSVSVGSTLRGEVSVDNIDDADSARGKNLQPACDSPVGDLAHLDSDAEDLSPKPSANILVSTSRPVHTNSPPNSLPDVDLGKD